MLELAILGLLTEESLHGYELKKQLADMLGFASGVSFGSLYPALGRLEAAGAVEAVEPAPPGVSSRRGKKVYRITSRGLALFEELLAAESTSNDDDRVFALRLAFARHLPPGARLSMLERRRARLSERLARLGARMRAGRNRLDGYGRTLAEHDRDITERDLSWIDQLIARERSGATVGPGPAPAAVPSISAMRRPRGAASAGPTFTTEGLRPPTTQEVSRP